MARLFKSSKSSESAVLQKCCDSRVVVAQFQLSQSLHSLRSKPCLGSYQGHIKRWQRCWLIAISHWICFLNATQVVLWKTIHRQCGTSDTIILRWSQTALGFNTSRTNTKKYILHIVCFGLVPRYTVNPRRPRHDALFYAPKLTNSHTDTVTHKPHENTENTNCSLHTLHLIPHKHTKPHTHTLHPAKRSRYLYSW